MGLNDTFEEAQGQILMMQNVPSINLAYVMVVQDESRRMMSGNNYGTSSSIDPTTMFSQHSGSKSKRNYNLVCDFCHLKGHTRDQCYKLMKCEYCNKIGHLKESCYKIVGYPSDFKGKKRANDVQMEGNGMQFSNSGVSTTTPTQGSNCANMAGNYVCNDVNGSNWIIDTCATNHMTGNKDLLQNHALVGNVGHVQWSTGDSAAVTHTGNHQLSGGDVLSNAICVPVFRFNLLSVSNSTKDLNCYATFFPTFCMIQDLLSGRVKKIGRELDRLYYLQSFAKNKRVAVPHSFAVTRGIAGDGSATLWLKRMGHVPVSVLKRIHVFQGSNNKFSPRAVRSILLGYAPYQKGYKLLDIKNKVIFISRDVAFHEDVFPFQLLSDEISKHLFLDSPVIPRQEFLDDTSKGPIAHVLPLVHCHTDRSLPQTNVASDDPAICSPTHELAPEEIADTHRESDIEEDTTVNTESHEIDVRKSTRVSKPPA
ncbi:hypothetical protein A4A49_25437 [Nicotiana attenuata]|uniref:CCHC-type domain-containing protein n=1 Tax=Nicotiana attenuata TaxID=49451 RepID=A0A314KLT9_NICAT|nr:hypothetical protein A4A49_25437 [Nicotiana attenuata]